MSTDVFSIIHIRVGTLPKTVPDVLRYVEIAPGPVIPVKTDLQNCPLRIIADSVNIIAAKTKVYHLYLHSYHW